MRKISVICALFVLLCAVSCQKENGLGHSGKSREIKVQLGNDQVTKSAPATGEKYLFSIPVTTETGLSLSLDAYISDNCDDLSSYVTKGAPVTTANLASKYGSFTTTVFKGGSVYADDVTDKPMSGVSASPSGDGEWTFDEGPYYWPEGNDNLSFCSSAPSSATGVTNLSWNGGAKVTFNYTDTPAGAGSDAKNQKDIIFGINTQNRSSHDTYAWINFSHALTSVKFIKGDIEGCTIETVSLKNFKSSGKATGTPSGNSLTFTWSDQATLKDYVQTFGTAVDDLDDKASLDPTEDGSCTFMMIPQALDASASVEILISESDGTSRTISVNLGSITEEKAGSEGNAAKLKDWSGYAGKVITMRVNMSSIGTVEVDEVFDGASKEDVGAKNTGNVPVFVRAAVVANWVNEAGDALMTCDITSEGNLTGYLEEDSNWILHTDGYFYYKKALAPESVTEGKIFQEYVPGGLPSSSIHHLDVVVLLQSVEYDSDCSKAMAAWGIPEGILTSDIE